MSTGGWLSSGGDDSYSDNASLTSNSMLMQTLMSNSSFFNFESFFLPKTLKELFKYSAHMFITNDAINPAIEKLAEYPITEFIFRPILREKEGTDEYKKALEQRGAITRTWEHLFENHYMAKSFAIKLSTNYYVYGNAFVSVYEPFNRILICGQCNEHHMVSKVKWEWDKSKLQFKITKCHKCGFKGLAKFYDKPITDDPTKINLISWYPGLIDIDFDPYSGSREYYVSIPEDQVEKIKRGNKLMLEKTPKEVIEAVRMNRGKRDATPKIKLRRDNIFHLLRPTVDMPGAENPWGMPVTVSVLRNILYLTVMKRAQLALMLDHIIPFRVLFPGSDVGANTTMPIDLGDWRKRMQGELKKWKRDPLYIMLSPIPLEQTQIGGQGKSLMVYPEMKQTREEILQGINVPLEFVQGGLTFTGSSVSLRMLENTLMNQVEQVIKCFRWICRRVAQISGLELVEADLRQFKMADDVQMKQLMFAMWQAQAISGELLGQWGDFDYAEEAKKRTQENKELAIAQATAQAEAMVAMQALQNLLTNALPPEMMNTMPTLDPAAIDQAAQAFSTMDPDKQEYYLQMLGAQNPDAARELSSRLATNPSDAAGNAQAMLMMNPLQQADAMSQMTQRDPAMAIMVSSICRQWGMDSFGVGDMGGGKGGKGGEGPKTHAMQKTQMEQSMPEQKPPTRKGGSPM